MNNFAVSNASELGGKNIGRRGCTPECAVQYLAAKYCTLDYSVAEQKYWQTRLQTRMCSARHRSEIVFDMW